MKPPQCVPIRLLAIAVATLVSTAGCTKSDGSRLAEAGRETKAAVTNAAEDIKIRSQNTWNRIKDLAFDKRSEFSSTLNAAAKRMDDAVAAVQAEAQPGSPARTAALSDYNKARAEFKAKIAALNDATAETWADAKVKASKAWEKAQAAYERTLE